MATYTNHYEMTKQQSPERVSVGLLNDNFDIIDGVMFANQEKADQMADDYNASETYNTGDYVRRENYLYKCNTDNTTGTWDVTKWDRVKVMDAVETAEDGVDNAFKTMGIMGAKNLLQYPYYHTTKTEKGITYTDNRDGTITASGTSSSANANFYLTNITYNGALALQDGTYKVSLNPTSSIARIRVGQFSADNTSITLLDVYGGEEVTFTASSDYHYSFVLQVPTSGSNFTTPITFYPMLRLATDQDDTWQPYAMTNKELTDVVKCNQTTAGTYTLQATVNSNKVVTYAWVSTT